MKYPLNKSRTEQRITPEEQFMNPELQKVMNLANEIKQTDPVALEEIRKGIERAQAAQEQALKAKETAETEEGFNKACDDAVRAREKEAFFQRVLKKQKYTPRIDEEEYFRNVDIIKCTVKQAAEDFRETAKTAMAEIVAAKAAYLKLVSEADKVLTALDNASNVLQSKYRYRITEYSDGTATETEDPNEWLRHTVRFGSGRGHDLVCCDPEKKNLLDPYDKTVCAAWNAAERAAR